VNVGTGIETPVSSLWTLMTTLSGLDPGVRSEPGRPGSVERVCLDPSRAVIHLGWRPWTTVRVGATAMLEAAGVACRPVDGPLDGPLDRPGGRLVDEVLR